jgi:hypothetical protein
MLWLFTTLYSERNPTRKAEYAECLRRNLENTGIDEMCLLVEGKGFEVPESPKIRIRKIINRPLYSDFFKWIDADIFKLGDKVAVRRMLGLPEDGVVCMYVADSGKANPWKGGAIPEPVEDGVSGTLVDTGDTERLAKGVWRCLQTILRCVVGSVQQDVNVVLRDFTLRRMLEGYEAFYDALAERGAGVARQGEVLHG